VSGLRLPDDWFPRPLPANVSLGEGSWLYSSFAFLHYRSRQALGVEIGAHSGVYNGSFFNLGPSGRVRIGDYSTLVGVIVSSDAEVVIGNYCFLSHEVVLAEQFAAVPGMASDATAPADRRIAIGDNVWIGARAVILGGVTIGENCIIGAGAVVESSAPPDSIVAGSPARVVGRVRARSP
jgi:acetyltransferase-like isoleucine patch superfamily enzyme